MSRRRRNFTPREFESVSMRPWDNFFWWLEIEGLPPKTIVLPDEWPKDRGKRPANFAAKVARNGRVRVQSGSRRTTVWLTPEMFDFDQPSVIEVNRRRIGGRDRQVTPSLDTLLEDARRRGDLQHPFWAKVESGEPAR